MVLRKPGCYKLISRYLENVFYHCSCRCTYVFPGYFQVNLIFTKRSGSSPGLYLAISALYLPAFHTAAQVYTCQWGEFVLIISVTGFKVHGDWHGPDKLLPSSHLIQSCSSKVLPIPATVWCFRRVQRTQATLGRFCNYWAIDMRGKSFECCYGSCGQLAGIWHRHGC